MYVVYLDIQTWK